MATSAGSARPVGTSSASGDNAAHHPARPCAQGGHLPRHISFVETNRSTPSREIILKLTEQLEIPLREQNELLLAAGYAPAFRQRPLQDPALAGARQAIARLLAGHEPYPALAFDRHWNVVAVNQAIEPAPLRGADAPPAAGQRAAQ
jgi:hypothetical protein